LVTRPGYTVAMSAQRAGVAIVRVELEREAATRALIRVVTVDDVTGPVAEHDRESEGRPFADVEAAVAYLARWLHGWFAR
jgi:hypothetical protein